MSATSDIATQQNKSASAAQGKKNGLLAKLKDPKKAIMDSVMNKVMGSMGIQSPEEMKADMQKDKPAPPEAQAVEHNEDKDRNDILASSQGGNDFENDPSTDGVDTATAIPTTEGVDEAGEEVPNLNEPTLNDPELKEPALATPVEERPELNAPTEADAQPPALATPHQDEPNLDEPEQKEPEQPKEMSNPTLKEKPSKNDSRLKPEMGLPTEGDLQ